MYLAELCTCFSISVTVASIAVATIFTIALK